MRVVAVGPKELLIGLMLAGIKDVFETEDPEEAVEHIGNLVKDKDVGAIIIAPKIFDKTHDELKRIRGGETLPILARFPANGVEFR